MASPQTDFPPIRACIFDMDGLLINSEDIITLSVDQLLLKYGRPSLPKSIRAKMMGVPKSTNGDLFHDWAQLPIQREQFAREFKDKMRLNFPNCQPLPGAERILSSLSRACNIFTRQSVELALASTTTSETFELKTSNPATSHLLGFIQPSRRVLGDDPRVGVGRSKPAPDMYLIALESLNSTVDLGAGERPILPEECLVFEDSVIGVEAGRRAGMRVIWVPHPDLAAEYQPMEEEVLAGRMEMIEIGDQWQLGQINDGWAERIASLEHFDLRKYGFDAPC
ncbi:HAD-like domain-containing protein [Xylaria bambusicola]|uniref:HAD-like domain-containing protein n=1 Tax=Xylaria bambusicola TaxID=326684 RepID=UPI002008BFE9|nr:HAD-like domain-containing protein [Xylaria bambusicola]KAI0509505.1 HAD-like domain-containing protein [Xylaria bambusicola]